MQGCKNVWNKWIQFGESNVGGQPRHRILLWPLDTFWAPSGYVLSCPCMCSHNPKIILSYKAAPTQKSPSCQQPSNVWGDHRLCSSQKMSLLGSPAAARSSRTTQWKRVNDGRTDTQKFLPRRLNTNFYKCASQDWQAETPIACF